MVGRFFQRKTPKNPLSSADETAEVPARAKTTIGIGALIEQRYRLDGEVGRGGMGIVYRAHDMQLDRDVAFKVINVAEANTGTREQFLREAKFTAQLHHPHIIAVYETGMIDTGALEPAPFMAMEFVHGPSLDDLRGLTFAQIIDLACQICDALAYAHDQGLVHRDLKPGNVLVEKHGFRYDVKLMDFGLAQQRDIGELPAQASVAGTVYYLAPEVIEGKPADVAADLYALGVMLYEMVTGRVPFSDFDSQSILSQHLKESVTPPSHTRSDIPPTLESIILRLLAKDPKDRFASAREVSTALEQIVVTPEYVAALNNLPQLALGFVGREKEIAEVAHRLEANRLVTLTGAGGIGKTRLALATAESLIGQFSDGVWFVDMGWWSDPTLVPQIVATALGIREETRRSLMVSLTEQLREKNLLLVLDECEHLSGACAQLVETLLRTCPAVRMIVTTSYPLGVSEETIYPVPSLASADAEKLFVERLRAASPQFKINDESLFMRVCQQLDGIPLAIELAAARAQALTLEKIDEQLVRLEAENGAALWHDQAARAVVGWSYGLLTPQAQELLNRLAVFVGGFTQTAIESFSGTGTLDVLPLLAQLVNASFINAGTSNSGEIRYRLLEPIREFALGKLQESGEEELARRHHRDGYLLLAMNAEQNFHGFEQGMWLKRLETEYANILAALDWTMSRPQDNNIAFHFGGALWQFWNERNYRRDGRERLKNILALPVKPVHQRARVPVLIGAGYLAIAQADYATAQKWLEQGLATAREISDSRSEAFALCGLGSIAQVQRDDDRASAFYREGWEKFQAAGNRWETANALFNLALSSLRQGDDYGARKLFTSSLEAFREVGDKRSAARVLNNLGLIAYDRQQYAEAQKFFGASLDLWRGLYDKFAIANLLNYLGYAALHQSQAHQAHKYLIESLALFKEINSRRHIADGLYGVAGVLVSRKPERAAQLIGAADLLLKAPGTSVESTNRADQNQVWVMNQMSLDAESCQAALAAGRLLSLEQAIDLASKPI